MEEDFKKFLKKSAMFFTLFILIEVLTMWAVASSRLPKEIKPFSMSDLAKALGFMLILFIGLNKSKILKIKDFPTGIWERIVSVILIVLCFLIYFPYKFFMINHLELVKNNLWYFVFGEFFILTCILICLIVFVYGRKFCVYFVRKFWKGLTFVLIGTAIVYHFILNFQKLWFFFSNVVAQIVVYLLNFIGPAVLNFNGQDYPILAFHNFIVGIAEPCSGIDSLLLFSFLFLGILAWEWGKIKYWKVGLLLIVGLIGTFLLNILRIFLLILVGAYISSSFAFNVFHTNASSIFFLVFFAIFWKLSYKWMKR